MIAKFFNKTKPISTLIVLIVLTIIYSISFFYLTKVEFTFFFFSKNILFFFILLATFFIINFIIRKNGLTKDNSYALLILVLCFGMFPFSALNKTLLATHFFLLIAYRRIYSLRTTKDTKEKLFDSAFWIGITTIIYPWSFIYMLLIYGAIFIFNKSNIKNIIIPIIGFIVPIFIYGVYLLLIDDFASFNLQLDYNFSFLNYNSLELLIPIALILGYLLWTILPATFKIIVVNNEFRASWFLLLIHLLISIIIIVPSLDKNGSEFLFLFFPTAIILTNYLQIVEEKWFKEIFLYLFLIIAVAIYFL